MVGAVGEPMEDKGRLRARVEAELREQGVPVAVDPDGIGRIAALLGAEDERKREKRLAALKLELEELEVRWKPAAPQEL